MDLTSEQIKEFQSKVAHWAWDNDGTDAMEYAEPGYTLHEGWVIIFADWNNFDDEVKASLGIPLDKDCDDLQIECEWSDEWDTCECGKAFRTSPDSYGGLPSYYFSEETCECTCIDCIEEDPEAYMEEWVNQRTNGARFFNPAEHGFIKVRPYADKVEQYGSFECGWHPGQADNPEGQLEILNEAGFDVVFDIQSSQFTTSWTIWVRPVNADGELEFADAKYTPEIVEEVREQVREILAHCDACRFDPSPATRMQAMLMSA